MNDCYKFLCANYKYTFEFEAFTGLEAEEFGQLKIFDNSGYVKTLSGNIMMGIFYMWLSPSYIEDRQQFNWQKELIEWIEGY